VRTFLGIELPKQVRENIDSIIQEEKRKSLPVKWVARENLHVTLKFLGEIHEGQQDTILPIIRSVCAKHKPFEMNIQGIGCFPNSRNPRVLWIGVSTGADMLTGLAMDLEQNLSTLGFKKEKRFHPHVTIGRTRKPCHPDEVLKREFTSEIFFIKDITFFKSTLTPAGPIYTSLARIPIG
jgi:2'-5' RNA ligase